MRATPANRSTEIHPTTHDRGGLRGQGRAPSSLRGRRCSRRPAPDPVAPSSSTRGCRRRPARSRWRRRPATARRRGPGAGRALEGPGASAAGRTAPRLRARRRRCPLMHGEVGHPVDAEVGGRLPDIVDVGLRERPRDLGLLPVVEEVPEARDAALAEGAEEIGAADQRRGPPRRRGPSHRASGPPAGCARAGAGSGRGRRARARRRSSRRARPRGRAAPRAPPRGRRGRSALGSLAARRRGPARPPRRLPIAQTASPNTTNRGRGSRRRGERAARSERAGEVSPPSAARPPQGRRSGPPCRRRPAPPRGPLQAPRRQSRGRALPKCWREAWSSARRRRTPGVRGTQRETRP